MRKFEHLGLASFAVALGAILLVRTPTTPVAAEPLPEALGDEYTKEIRPLLNKHCAQCHSGKRVEAEIDLGEFSTLAEVRKAPKTWQKMLEMLESGQMPPKDAKQPNDDERNRLRTWVRGYLKLEAKASAGDPGPVVLRRLNNAEYTYTLADLTGVDLKPAREFPADSAAGEGFTNTGNALVMSPALLTKYLNAAKEISRHAVLLPDGMRFSPSTSRRDWTNEILDQIRGLYREYSDSQGGSRVNLQGIVFDTNDGGRLPLEKYLAATLIEREALKNATKTVETVAHERKLSPKYLGLLWAMLNSQQSSPLFDAVRNRWQTAKPGDEKAIAAEVNVWQNALTRFQSVGHMKSWMVPVSPIAGKQDIRVKVPTPAKGNDVSLFLVAGDAGDGGTNDFVVWNQPRLAIPGRAEIPLRDVREFVRDAMLRRDRAFASTANCLVAAAEASASTAKVDVAELAKKHNVHADDLTAWLEYLGIGSVGTPRLDYMKNSIPKSGSYDFVRGWSKTELPALLANSSDQHVRVPGNMKPHAVCVHPSPTLNVAVGWSSPIADEVRIEGKITHAHPECGNGVTWSLELRRGATRQRLAVGVAQGGKPVPFGPLDKVRVQKGDLISLVVGPRDGNHSCDLTDIELSLKAGDKEWNLNKDVSPDVLAGNPHADRLGNKDVWHFYTEPVKEGDRGQLIPAGSVLSRWLVAQGEEKKALANAVQKLLTSGPPADPKNPDAVLYQQLASLGGPLLAKLKLDHGPRSGKLIEYGVDPALFGKHPSGLPVDANSLCVQAPSTVEVRLPADLFAGAELVTTGSLHPTATDGSVQIQITTVKPASATGLRSDVPVVVAEKGPSRDRWEKGFDAFRNLFPAALCYTKIVPVDEVVTLTLFHREDEHLARLMLTAEQSARLDRLWHELHYISHDAFTLVDAFNQLMEYATQDSNPKLFEPYRKPILDTAAAFKKELVDTEPKHLEALLQFASKAYRRPTTPAEKEELLGLYKKLRTQELPHDLAVRLTLAKVLVTPAFLYRLESAPAGAKATEVSDAELATRLSYFLTSSLPDDGLRKAAETNTLRSPQVISEQTHRLMKDPKVRRLATEFACHWLHIHGFDTLDEKSERHFPTFAKLKGDMYEESIRFFTDLFQNDRSIQSLLDADHTFVNEALAKHYGIPGITGPEWQRVDGMRKYGRGGILGLSTTLAKQSGASRTSPILRGNWVSEVLLGEKLPRPPKDVPQLPEDEATESKTVRQLVEKHSSDARCAVCHVRIDPFGFALEGYDAIGRIRTKDLGDRPIDTKGKLKDGTEFEGLDGLRTYLLTKRKDTFVYQFCRKLLGYALGRGIQLSDEPLLDEIQEQLKQHGYRISVAMDLIVKSKQFREIRGREFVVAEQ